MRGIGGYGNRPINSTELKYGAWWVEVPSILVIASNWRIEKNEESDVRQMLGEMPMLR
jgi:hypothetical protein